jgi:hypothetical protein
MLTVLTQTLHFTGVVTELGGHGALSLAVGQRCQDFTFSKLVARFASPYPLAINS